MTIALVIDGGAAAGANGGTTSPSVDTTGANFLAFAAGYISGASPTVSDFLSNTITGLTAKDTGSLTAGRLYYAKNAIVGASETGTVGGSSIFASLVFGAFSGVDTTAPFDTENGATTSGATSLASGSVTPSVAGCLALTALNDRGAGTVTIPTGYTLLDQIAFAGGNNFGCHVAYKILSGTSAENPSWSWTNNVEATVEVALFKAAGGGGGGSFRNFYGQSPFYGAQYAPTTPMERNLAVARYQRERAAEMRRFMAKVERRAA